MFIMEVSLLREAHYLALSVSYLSVTCYSCSYLAIVSGKDNNTSGARGHGAGKELLILP